MMAATEPARFAIEMPGRKRRRAIPTQAPPMNAPRDELFTIVAAIRPNPTIATVRPIFLLVWRTSKTNGIVITMISPTSFASYCSTPLSLLIPTMKMAIKARMIPESAVAQMVRRTSLNVRRLAIKSSAKIMTFQ